MRKPALALIIVVLLASAIRDTFLFLNAYALIWADFDVEF
jgi:hypothetical protein